MGAASYNAANKVFPTLHQLSEVNHNLKQKPQPSWTSSQRIESSKTSCHCKRLLFKGQSCGNDAYELTRNVMNKTVDGLSS